MTAPVDYSARAGLNPPPAGWTDDARTAHSIDEAQEHAAAGRLFWADVSDAGQSKIVDDTYPYPVLAIRLDTGYRTDYHAAAHRAFVAKSKRIEVLIGYAVFIPGHSKQILGRLTNTFGSQLEGIAPMTDMESGKGFAGPGNHSSEANDFQAELAAATGDRSRLIGYANGGDWANCWTARPSWMHRILADYSSTVVPGYFAQQYYGGLNYPTPAGFPRACAPFGSWVDMNSAAMSTDTLLDTLGLDWLSMTSKADVEKLIDEKIRSAQQAMFLGGEHGGFGPKENPLWARDAGHGVDDRLRKLEDKK